MTFEEYLKDKYEDEIKVHGYEFLLNYMISLYQLISLADEWHVQELKSISRKGANTTNSKYTTEQKSEWGKKGGRPKKNLQ